MPARRRWQAFFTAISATNWEILFAASPRPQKQSEPEPKNATEANEGWITKNQELRFLLWKKITLPEPAVVLAGRGLEPERHELGLSAPVPGQLSSA